jgi:hypothetical protein
LSEGIETERTGKKIEKIVMAEPKDQEDRIEGVDDEAKAEGAGKGGGDDEAKAEGAGNGSILARLRPSTTKKKPRQRTDTQTETKTPHTNHGTRSRDDMEKGHTALCVCECGT